VFIEPLPSIGSIRHNTWHSELCGTEISLRSCHSADQKISVFYTSRKFITVFITVHYWILFFYCRGISQHDGSLRWWTVSPCSFPSRTITPCRVLLDSFDLLFNIFASALHPRRLQQRKDTSCRCNKGPTCGSQIPKHFKRNSAVKEKLRNSLDLYCPDARICPSVLHNSHVLP
jgi:hypothetical protein